jgi:hypothetical protein
VRLTAANKNPWYVLATIYGEQAEGAEPWDYDEELAAKNRRAWNGWFCGGLSEEDRKDRAEAVGLDPEDLAPLTKTEVAALLKKLRSRLKDKTAELPNPAEDINFFKTYFSRFLNLEKYVFEKDAYFSSSTFSGYADFRSAKFKSTTLFADARFVTHVPKFHAADIYDDTIFPPRSDDLEYWPPLKGEDVMDAEAQKRAYNRLRLFMSRSLQIDEEQFFHRMEMRCKKETADKAHTPIYWFYEKLSDFGNSVVRPVFGMVLLIAVGAALMLFHLEMGKPATGAQFNTAVGWSISNTLPFLGFGKLYFGGKFALGLPVWLKVVGGVQTLFGFVLLFFLGLGLRNRFRLR